MRVPILAGNWKMNKTVAEARELVLAARDDLLAVSGVETVLCPPFTAISAVAELVAGTEIGVGAQDMYWEASGAYTGEVSPVMVKEFCQYVVIGHSERREYFGESDSDVNRKLLAAFAHGLTPIVCVGETLEIRKAGHTESWVKDQVTAALKNVTADQVPNMVFAYEPIWAIGTGLAATPKDAEHVCANVVRATVRDLYGDAAASAIRIQYGGSINPGNCYELMSQPNVDGGLVGGASLKAEDFVAVVRSTAAAAQKKLGGDMQ